MVENCFSSGRATAEAMVQDWRPASVDLDRREVNVGQIADGQGR